LRDPNTVEAFLFSIGPAPGKTRSPMGLFIVTSRPRPFTSRIVVVKNEPTVNVLPLLHRNKSQTVLASSRVSHFGAADGLLELEVRTAWGGS
jgi:hypothetical protein